MNVNKVIIVGRATDKPELRTTKSGEAVTRLGLATNRTWTDKNGDKQEQVEFHNAILFGRIAEIAASFIDKGSLTAIEGRLQTRAWTDKDGVEHKVTEIVVENLQLGPRPEPKPAPAPKIAAPKKDIHVRPEDITDEDDLPELNPLL